MGRDERLNRLPEIIFVGSLVVVGLSLLLFYLIDLRNALGLRSVLYSLEEGSFFFEHRPFFFDHFYRNGGIGEILQWVLLGSAAVISSYVAGRLAGRDRRAALFWLILGVAFTLMLIEDAGDPRHTIRSYVQALFSEVGQGIAGTITELIYFAVLAAVPIYALVFYRERAMRELRTRRYLIVGFVSYALAAGLSFVGSAFERVIDMNFYTWTGGMLRRFFVSIGDEQVGMLWQMYDSSQGWPFISFFLMDNLVEEAIELIGAGAFSAAAIAFLLAQRRTPEPTPSEG